MDFIKISSHTTPSLESMPCGNELGVTKCKFSWVNFVSCTRYYFSSISSGSGADFLSGLDWIKVPTDSDWTGSTHMNPFDTGCPHQKWDHILPYNSLIKHYILKREALFYCQRNDKSDTLCCQSIRPSAVHLQRMKYENAPFWSSFVPRHRQQAKCPRICNGLVGNLWKKWPSTLTMASFNS